MDKDVMRTWILIGVFGLHLASFVIGVIAMYVTKSPIPLALPVTVMGLAKPIIQHFFPTTKP